jgi:uncharacterized membrane protein
MTPPIDLHSTFASLQSIGLPAAPGQEPRPGAAAAPTTAQVQQMWSMLGIDGVNPTGASSKTKAGAKAAGGPSVASLGLPPVPKAKQTPQTAAAYESFASQLQPAMVAGAKVDPTKLGKSKLAGASKAAPGKQTENLFAEHFDFKAKSHQAANVLSQALEGLQAAQGNAMYAFMVLRLQHSSDNVKQLGQLANLASAMQKTTSDQQIQKSQEAEKSAEKAHKKAAKMGIFNKLLTVVFLIITVVAVLASPIAPMLMVAILAAMAIAAGVAGGVKGKKEGKGFDLFGGLEIASYVGDAMMMACGVGAVLTATRAVIKKSGEEAFKNVVRTGLKDTGRVKAAATAVASLDPTLINDGLRAANKAVLSESEKMALQGMQHAAEQLNKKTAKALIAKHGNAVEVLRLIGEGTETATLGNKAVTDKFSKALFDAGLKKAEKEAGKVAGLKGASAAAKKEAIQQELASLKEMTAAASKDSATRAAYSGGNAAVKQAVGQGAKLSEAQAIKGLEKAIRKAAQMELFREAFFEALKTGFGQTKALDEKIVKALGGMVGKFGAPAAAAGQGASAAGAVGDAAATGAKGVGDAAATAAEKIASASARRAGLDTTLHFGQDALNAVRKVGGSPILLNAGLGFGVATVDFAKESLIKYPSAMLQADADEAMADVKIWKSLYDSASTTYSALQDTLQNAVSGHSKTVDLTQQMLTDKQKTLQAINNHWGA